MFVKFLGEQRHIPSYFENANVLYTHVTVYKHPIYHAILDNHMHTRYRWPVRRIYALITLVNERYKSNFKVSM